MSAVPRSTDQFTVRDVAELLGIEPVTFRAYVSRGQAPKPDGHIDARTPYWSRSTIEIWRPGTTWTVAP